MAKKFVVETVTVVKQVYYVEVDDPTWAHDGIVMGELDPFAQESYTEDVCNTYEVTEFPAVQAKLVNAATMKYNRDESRWECETRWDLAK